MNQISRFIRPIKIKIKQWLSYTKTNWSLSDYPIEYRKQKIIDLSGTNLTMFPWEARIINWASMNADGFTRKEAYTKLEDKFNRYKEEHIDVCRPGIKTPIVYACHERVDHFEDEAVMFFKEIFNIDYYGIFISDESSMFDFCVTDDSLIHKQQLIKAVFEVDVSKIDGFRIVDILQLIREKKGFHGKG